LQPYLTDWSVHSPDDVVGQSGSDVTHDDLGDHRRGRDGHRNGDKEPPDTVLLGLIL
jgi:hypothetical protein